MLGVFQAPAFAISGAQAANGKQAASGKRQTAASGRKEAARAISPHSTANGNGGAVFAVVVPAPWSHTKGGRYKPHKSNRMARQLIFATKQPLMTEFNQAK